jgi:hypothetical protein
VLDTAIIEKLHYGNVVGYCDPNYQVQNIPILKNGTTFISDTVSKLNWQVKPVPINKKISRFVILRDPYERWLTGFAEDLKMFIFSRPSQEVEYLNNLFINNIDWFFDFLIDRDILYFDTHAQLQINQLDWIIDSVGLDAITFIKMTDKLGQTLNDWLHGEGCKNNFNNAKVNARDKKNDVIYKKIVTYFFDGRNVKRKNKVLEYLAPDYELFNSVRFINPT